MIFNIIASIVALVFALLYYEEGVSSQLSPYAWFAFSLFAALMVVFFVASRARNRQLTSYWFSPSYIVLFGLIVVNLQTIANVLLGYAPISSYLQTTSYDGYVNQVMFAGLLSVTGFIVGCYNGMPRHNLLSTRRLRQTAQMPNLKVFVALLVLFFVLFVVNIDIMSFVTGLHYEGSGSHDRVTNSSYMFYEQLLNACIIIVFSIVAFKAQWAGGQMSIRHFIRQVPAVVWFVIVAYMGLRLLSGDRGPVLYSIGVVGYSYLMASRRRFSIVVVLAALAVGAVATTIIGTTRGLSKQDSFMDRVEMAVEIETDDAPSICRPTQELANSVSCNFIAIADIDTGKVAVQNGKYSFYNIVTCFPGSLKLFNMLFGLTQKDINSAEYITISYFGQYYPLGLGTTPTAEGILDFGLIGCFILHLLFGIFLRRIDGYFVYNQHITMVMMIIAIKFASEAIYISRFTFTGMLGKALYVAIIYLCIKFVVDKFRKS